MMVSGVTDTRRSRAALLVSVGCPIFLCVNFGAVAGVYSGI